ncbi:DUF3168 domain-containing protein [Cryobacterium sp. Hh7]|nr:DUF3168 domain-containing protein [Cryobacterium sp. Hh7]
MESGWPLRKHTTWLKSRIQTISAFASNTFVTTAPPNTPLPYVLIHPSDGTDRSDRLAGPNAVQNPRWVIHSVGSTYDQCAWAAEQVKAVLVVAGLGVTPTITGERAGRVWYSVPQPVQTDDDVTPPLIFHTAECGFESTLTA